MERERITISIKKSLLEEIDRTIDSVKIRNRSHAIETLCTRSLNYSDKKNAVVILGGDDAIKQIPAVKENLKNLKKYGFTKVYIAVGYLADKIKASLGDGSNFGLKLEYLGEGEGSGGAILPLKKLFQQTFRVPSRGERSLAQPTASRRDFVWRFLRDPFREARALQRLVILNRKIPGDENVFDL